MADTYRSEFRRKRFGFNDVQDQQIYSVQLLCIPSHFILIYRFIISLFFVGNLILSIVISDRFKWLIFLTSWSWLLCTVYYVVITAVSLYYWLKLRHQDPNDVVMPAGVRVLTWVLFDMSLGISLLVTLMFWGFVVRPGNFRTPMTSYLSISEHMANLVLLCIDFFFHRIPVRIFHSIYPIVFGFIYLLFSAIYYVVTKDVIYGILNWGKHVDSAILYTLVSLSFMIVGHIVFYFLHRLKLRFCLDRSRDENDESLHVPS